VGTVSAGFIVVISYLPASLRDRLSAAHAELDSGTEV